MTGRRIGAWPGRAVRGRWRRAGPVAGRRRVEADAAVPACVCLFSPRVEDEMFSDIYKIREVANGLCLEVEGKVSGPPVPGEGGGRQASLR